MGKVVSAKWSDADKKDVLVKYEDGSEWSAYAGHPVYKDMQLAGVTPADWVDPRDYKSKRADEYKKWTKQLEMIYDDIEAGKLYTSGTFYKDIKAIKDKYAKG